MQEAVGFVVVREAFGGGVPLVRVSAACAGGAAALVLASHAIRFEGLPSVLAMGYEEASALARTGFTCLRTLSRGRTALMHSIRI